MNLSEMSNKQLEKEFISASELINDIGCFGVKDVIYLEQLQREIARRGGEIHTSHKVKFPESEEDN
jgi:hypothetical protein